MGVLSFDGRTYRFKYLAAARTVPDFAPLLGFADLDSEYESDELFPLFAQRAMDPRRPDFERYVSELGLEHDQTTPWEQISRSGGGLEGDTLQIFPVPRFVDGIWKCYFLTHGMRHLLEKSVYIDGKERPSYAPAQLETILGGLTEGEPLRLAAEPENDYDSLALLVLNETLEPLGYVPNLLLDAMHRVDFKSKVKIQVEQVNPPEAGWHLRLLVAMSAELDASFEFFGGPAWNLAVSDA